MAVDTPSARAGALLRFPASDEQRPGSMARVTPFVPVAHAAAPASEVSVRLALYSSTAALPAVWDLEASDPAALLAEACQRAVSLAREQHSRVPAEAIVAVVENLIHAQFAVATISVAPDGSIAVSDHGPGIAEKDVALLPGFTTATAELRRFIRGVGSGLPTARRLMESIGGRLRIDDNMGGGTVVTLEQPARAARAGRHPETASTASPRRTMPSLTGRQRRVLLLLADSGELGPSSLSQRLSCSLTTAFRELVALETMGLVVPDGAGKRQLTQGGVSLVEELVREEWRGQGESS